MISPITLLCQGKRSKYIKIHDHTLIIIPNDYVRQTNKNTLSFPLTHYMTIPNENAR